MSAGWIITLLSTVAIFASVMWWHVKLYIRPRDKSPAEHSDAKLCETWSRTDHLQNGGKNEGGFC